MSASTSSPTSSSAITGEHGAPLIAGGPSVTIAEPHGPPAQAKAGTQDADGDKEGAAMRRRVSLSQHPLFADKARGLRLRIMRFTPSWFSVTMVSFESVCSVLPPRYILTRRAPASSIRFCSSCRGNLHMQRLLASAQLSSYSTCSSSCASA